MQKGVLKPFFMKKTLQQKCFPVNVEKEQLRTVILRMTSEWLLQ